MLGPVGNSADGYFSSAYARQSGFDRFLTVPLDQGVTDNAAPARLHDDHPYATLSRYPAGTGA